MSVYIEGRIRVRVSKASRDYSSCLNIECKASVSVYIGGTIVGQVNGDCVSYCSIGVGKDKGRLVCGGGTKGETSIRMMGRM